VGVFNAKGGTITLGANPYGTPTGDATIRNVGTFIIQSNLVIYDNGPSVKHPANEFFNFGVLKMSASGGGATIAARLDNSKDVKVQAGTLTFTGGGRSSGGTYTVASEALLVFAGAGTEFTSTNDSFAGYGTVDIAGGEVDFSGSKSGADLLFEQTGGVIGGAGTLTILGTAEFRSLSSSSDVQTGEGTTLLNGLTVDQAYLYLDGGRTLENAGTFKATSSAFITLGANTRGPPTGVAKIQNDVNKTFDLQSDFSIHDNGPFVTGKANTFANAGAFEKTGGAGTSEVDPNFVNNGNTVVSSGTLDFRGAVSGTGVDTISGHSTLQFGSTVATSATIGSQTIGFSGGGGTLVLLDPAGFYGKISGFASTDTVELFGAWSLLGTSQNAGVTSLTLTNGSADHSFLGRRLLEVRFPRFSIG
jgi:hypothetical protein